MQRPTPLVTTSNFFRFLFILLSISFLSSCSSTGLFATRKYTNGHFSDPIAKIKTGQLPGAPHIALSPSVIQPQSVTAHGTTDSKIASAKTKPAPIGIVKQILAFTNQQKSLKVASANSTKSFSQGHVSVNSVTDYVTGYYAEHGKSGNVKILVIALVWIVLSLLFLGLALAGGDSDAAGLFFILFGLTAGIGFLFLIYWAIIAVNVAMNNS